MARKANRRCEHVKRSGDRCDRKATKGKRFCSRCARYHQTAGKAGRPPILHQEIPAGTDQATGKPKTTTREERILTVLRAGAADKHAAAAAGVSQRTLQAWLARAAEHDPGAETSDAEIPKACGAEAMYVLFARRANEARGQGVAGQLAAIGKAARDGDWRAAAWLLERRHPEEYGKRLAVGITSTSSTDPAPHDESIRNELEEAIASSIAEDFDLDPSQVLK